MTHPGGTSQEAINRFMSRLLEIFDESHIILQSVGVR